MPIRTANATWKGDLKTGKGIVSSESGLLKDADYNFAQRFEDAKGTNPEELLGAAHAACYSMALSAGLSGVGSTVKSIKTTDKVHIEKVGDGFTITKIEVNCDAEVDGIDEKKFQEIAANTNKGCPVARALTGVQFILKATLKK